MHNVVIQNFGKFCSLTLFHDLIFYPMPKRRSKPVRVPTPFFDDDMNQEFAVALPSDEDIAFKKEESLRCSLSRTRRRIQDIAFSFPYWSWFCTFTFDKDIVGDRYDYDNVSRLFQSFLRDLQEKCPDVVYIVVPELHEDGAYHFHGLFSSDLSCTYAGKFKLKGDKFPRPVWHVDLYTLGFSEAEPVRSVEASSKYISSYITKDLCAVSKYKKRYWYTYSKIHVTCKLKYLIHRRFIEKFLSSLLPEDFSFGGVFNGQVSGFKFSKLFLKTEALQKVLLFFDDRFNDDFFLYLSDSC